MNHQDLRARISDIQKEIHIYVQSNRSLTSSDSLQLDHKLQEKIKTLRNVREIEYKLLKIAEIRQQPDPKTYITKTSAEQLKETKKDNENLYTKIGQVDKESEQKIKENINLTSFQNVCIIEELAARSFNSDGFTDKLIIPKFEELFKNEENASDLSDYVLNNPDCNIIIFCSIISSLFDSDDTTKIFIKKIKEDYSKFEKILPRLIHLYPDTFANKKSFIYKCGFEIKDEIIQKAQGEIKISLSGSKTQLSSPKGSFQSLSSIFKNEEAYNKFIQPRNIFMSNYSVAEITDVFAFQSSLAFGLFKPDFIIRNNYQAVKPVFMKKYFDIERVCEFLVSDLNRMIKEKDESKVVSYLTKIKNVRENLKKNKNFFAASFLSFSKVIQKAYNEAHNTNISQETRNLIKYFDSDIIEEKRNSFNELSEGKIPDVIPTQIEFNQGLFYFVPYSTNDSLRKKRKGDIIPIKDYFDAAVKYIGLTVPYQHPIGPQSIDINLFRDFALMAQFGR